MNFSSEPCPYFSNAFVISSPSSSSVSSRIGVPGDLANASLSGSLIPQLGQLESLMFLDLSRNKISGQIPSELGRLTNLVSLELFSNNFTGQIPMSLTNLPSLQFLDLSHNLLSGPIPDNGSFSRFTNISFSNNPNLCGRIIGRPCSGSFPYSSPPPPFSHPGRSASSTRAFIGGVATGPVLLVVALAFGITWWFRRKPQEQFFDVEEDPKVTLGQLKRYSLKELRAATDGFSKKNVRGTGGFGNVYEGHLRDGTLVAIKQRKDYTLGGEQQFLAELEMVSVAVHHNLLPVYGFCMIESERFLVILIWPTAVWHLV